jgi:hypothetical protein
VSSRGTIVPPTRQSRSRACRRAEPAREA